jgi:hypothetical protein
MRRLLVILCTLAFTLSAANFRLYMKDGGFELVREYKIEDGHLKYYSVERSEWDEIPAELADLKRTESERSARQEAVDKTSRQIEDEDQARRDALAEIKKIPRDPGVYMLDNDQLRIFKMADCAVHDDKKRTILKYVSPIPLVAGKSVLETNGEHATEIVKDKRPEFFLQTTNDDNIGFIRLTPAKGIRIVERITIAPVVNEITEDRDKVEFFSKQLTDSGLYKIWPQEDLKPGEYAIIEYTDGKIDARVWDFRVP